LIEYCCHEKANGGMKKNEASHQIGLELYLVGKLETGKIRKLLVTDEVLIVLG
jgi:hypothetical protein